MEQIFKSLTEMANYIVPFELEGSLIPAHQDTIIMTLHNNLVFYNAYKDNKKVVKRIVSYGLHAKKVVQSIDIENLDHGGFEPEITCIV